MRELLLKMAGGEQSPPRAKAGEIFSAWVGSCLAIACIALLERYATGNSGFPLLIGSFGASAVLAFGAIRRPLAQPRNLVGGHFQSALVGVSWARAGRPSTNSAICTPSCRACSGH